MNGRRNPYEKRFVCSCWRVLLVDALLWMFYHYFSIFRLFRFHLFLLFLFLIFWGCGQFVFSSLTRIMQIFPLKCFTDCFISMPGWMPADEIHQNVTTTTPYAWGGGGGALWQNGDVEKKIISIRFLNQEKLSKILDFDVGVKIWGKIFFKSGAREQKKAISKTIARQIFLRKNPFLKYQFQSIWLRVRGSNLRQLEEADTIFVKFWMKMSKN